MLIADNEVVLEKYEHWKDLVKAEGLKVNSGKTKLIISAYSKGRTRGSAHVALCSMQVDCWLELSNVRQLWKISM